MKKFVLIASMAFISLSSFATEPISPVLGGGSSDKSNAPGIINIGLGSEFVLGGATITPKNGGTAEDGLGAIANYYLRGQYGLSDMFSAGISLKYGGAGYLTTSGSSTTALVVKGITIGLEGKFYAVNHPKFNMYLAPGIGFNSSSLALLNGSTSGAELGTGTASGLTYSFIGGFNWYWVDFLGMSLDMGYYGNSLSGTLDNKVSTGTAATDLTVSGGGFYFGIGLISKFGGK